MNIENINNKINKFSEDRDWDQFHSPKNLVMALSGEVGELNEIFQWLTEEQSSNLASDTKKHTEEEVADIAIVSKLENNELKYPIHKAKGNAKKYNEL